MTKQDKSLLDENKDLTVETIDSSVDTADKKPMPEFVVKVQNSPVSRII